MIELNIGQKIAGFIFAVLILLVSLTAMAEHPLVTVIGFGVSAALVIWCLYKKKG